MFRVEMARSRQLFALVALMWAGCSMGGVAGTSSGGSTTGGRVGSTSATGGTSTTGSTTVGSTTGSRSASSSSGSVGTTGAGSSSGSVGTTGAGNSNGSVGTTGTGSSSGSGSSSGGSSSGFVPVPAFYVATNGDDQTNPGTLAYPFATLARAQAAMQASGTVKTTYVRAGVYTPVVSGGSCDWGSPAGSSIGLTSADDGETWSYYPPDGYGSAIIDGQSTVGTSGPDGGNGTGCAFGDDHATDVSVIGLQFQSYRFSAFWGWGATNLTFEDNEVHDTTAAAFAVGAVLLVSSPNATVSHNYLHDLAYMGVVVSDDSPDGGEETGTTVDGNVILNSCTWPAAPGGNDQNGGDCGAIYLWSSVNSVSTSVDVTNNYVRDVNVSSDGGGDFGDCCAMGIYLDHGTNNVTISGNVITGTLSSCFMLQGGTSNVIEGNLCDVGASGQEILDFQNDDLTQMTGNRFENNVVVVGRDGGAQGFLGASSPPTPITIQDNAYFNYAGATVDSNGTGNAGSDAAPTYENPGVSCWSPTVAPASPVFNAPVSFPGLPGTWGPPGLVMPQTGTPPSWPHGC
jgi:hypothetical protein